jgi:hypothetical protein
MNLQINGNTSLENNYKFLNEERNQIQVIVRDFETLDSAGENSQLVVTSNYYKFILLLFVAVLLVFLLLKYSLKWELFFLFILLFIGVIYARIFTNYSIYNFNN